MGGAELRGSCEDYFDDISYLLFVTDCRRLNTHFRPIAAGSGLQQSRALAGSAAGCLLARRMAAVKTENAVLWSCDDRQAAICKIRGPWL